MGMGGRVTPIRASGEMKNKLNLMFKQLGWRAARVFAVGVESSRWSGRSFLSFRLCFVPGFINLLNPFLLSA